MYVFDAENFTGAEVLNIREQAILMAVQYGYIMFFLGLVIGALVGIGLYRAFISPGFLLDESEPIESDADQSYTVLSERLKDDKGA